MQRQEGLSDEDNIVCGELTVADYCLKLYHIIIFVAAPECRDTVLEVHMYVCAQK